MNEATPLHRSAEIEDLRNITDEDKKNIQQQAEKGKNLLQINEQNQHLNHSLQDIHKTPLHQQNSNPK